MKNWMIPAALVLAVMAGHGGEVVANYRQDFRSQAPLVAGWRYLWNCPEGWRPGEAPLNMWSGRIGDPSSHAPLVESDGVWTADGNRNGNDSAPDSFVCLDPTGGHPGGGAEAYGNQEGRFAIAAYTIREPGSYALGGANLSVGKSSNGDGIELVVLVNGEKPLLQRHVAAGETLAFDLPLGTLKAGDTISVGAGPWIKIYSDAFQWDFSIVRKD